MGPARRQRLVLCGRAVARGQLHAPVPPFRWLDQRRYRKRIVADGRGRGTVVGRHHLHHRLRGAVDSERPMGLPDHPVRGGVRCVHLGDREGCGAASTGIDRVPLVVAQPAVDPWLSGPGGGNGSRVVLVLGLGHVGQLERRVERVDEDAGGGVYYFDVPAVVDFLPEHRGGTDADSGQAARGSGCQSSVLLLGAGRWPVAGLPDDLRGALFDGGRHADHPPAGFPGSPCPWHATGYSPRPSGRFRAVSRRP